MVATRKKKDAPASTELTADQVRQTYQASISTAEEKLKAKDLYIASLGNEINHLKAVNSGLAGKMEDQIPGTQELSLIREKIRLVEEELRAKQDQHLISLFASEHLDQVDMLSRRMDYYEQTQQELATRAARISELERNNFASTPTYTAGIDDDISDAELQSYAQQYQPASEGEQLREARQSIRNLLGRIADLEQKPDAAWEERYAGLEERFQQQQATNSAKLGEYAGECAELRRQLQAVIGTSAGPIGGSLKAQWDLNEKMRKKLEKTEEEARLRTRERDDLRKLIAVKDASLESASKFMTEQADAGRAELAKQYQELRQALDRATQHACDWQEKARKAEREIEHLRGELEENGAAQVEALTAQVCLLEADLKREREMREAAQVGATRLAHHHAEMAEMLKEAQAAKLLEHDEESIDHATALACQRLEEIERLKKQIEKQAGENTRLKQETRRAEKNESTLLDRAHKAEENAVGLAAQVDSLTAQLEEHGTDQVEALTARIALLKADLSEERRNMATMQVSFRERIAAQKQQQNSGPEDRDELKEAWLKATREVAHLNKLVEGQSTKKLRARIKELEQYEAMFACKVYADRPAIDSTEATLMLENQHQLGQIADLEQTLLEHDATYLQAAKHMEARISELEQEIVNLGAQLHGYGEEAANRISELEQEKAQAIATAEEIIERGQAIGEENTNLRAQLAEQEDTQATEIELHHDAIACQKCAEKDQRIKHLEALHKDDNAIVMHLQHERDWNQRCRRNEELEPAHKLAAMALREKTIGKGEQFTRVYVEDLADEMGMKRQAAGRRLNELINYGAFGAYRDKEEAIVPDKRLGTRKIEKELINIVATDLLERVEDLKRTDGKSHGGSLPRCRNCHGENTLRKIHHTVCLSCGHEDILMPEDAQMALDRARAVVTDDVPAAVAEAITIMAQVQPVEQKPAPIEAQVEQIAPAVEAQASEVQDEQKCSAPIQSAAPDLEGEIMAVARCNGFPPLTLPTVQIAAGEAAWSRWLWMSHATNEQIAAVHTCVIRGQEFAVSEVQDEHECPEQAQSAAPLEWTEEDSARLTADTWIEIERKDPGCYIPGDIIDYWRIHYGRSYTPTKPREETAPVSEPEEAAPARPTHKAVDLRTGQIVEVNE